VQGKNKKVIVPKPGEFVVVSTDKKVDPAAELSVGLDDLLDVTSNIKPHLQSARQTIRQRLESARKTQYKPTH